MVSPENLYEYRRLEKPLHMLIARARTGKTFADHTRAPPSISEADRIFPHINQVYAACATVHVWPVSRLAEIESRQQSRLNS